eukprot:3577273-Alexandrium_andersonii.AAC.1
MQLRDGIWAMRAEKLEGGVWDAPDSVSFVRLAEEEELKGGRGDSEGDELKVDGYDWDKLYFLGSMSAEENGMKAERIVLAMPIRLSMHQMAVWAATGCMLLCLEGGVIPIV